MEDNRSLRGYTLLITTLSSFLAPFMSNAVNLAIQDISQELGADAITGTWIVSVYLLASAAFLLPSGRAADLYGRKKVYVTGMVIYGAASALSAVASSAPLLIAYRALQGLGSAFIFSTGVAILVSVFPLAQRGRVLGINTAATYTGLSLGPVLGGLLTEYLGWRSIFVLNAVIPAVVVPLTLLKLRREWTGATKERYDWVGAILYAVALLALIYGVSSLYEVAYARWLALGGGLGLVAFVVVEIGVAQPLLDLRRFRGNITFIFSNVAALIHYSATFAITYLLSRYLQAARGFSPEEAGRILVAQPVVMAICSPLAGWLSDRVEPRVVSSLGMALTGGGIFILSTFGATTPILIVIATLALIGLGFGLFSSPNVNAIMSTVEKRDYGVASSTLGTMRVVGQSLSLSAVLLLFSIYVGRVKVDPQVAPQLIDSMGVAFRLFAGLCAAGVLFSLARGRVRGQGGKGTR